MTHKKELRILDWLVILTFLMMIGTRMITYAYISHIAQDTKAEIEQVANAYERNPAAKLFFSMNYLKVLLLSLILPALGVALYYKFRKKVMDGTILIDSLAFYVTFLFLVILLNIINDLSFYIGRIL